MLLKNNLYKKNLNKENLAEIFFSGCKTSEYIGVEIEKILVYKKNNKAITYNDATKILKLFDDNKWQKIYERTNLIGLKGEQGNISLEPGSQIELSLNPYKKIEDIEFNLINFYSNLKSNAKKIGAVVIDKGIQPLSTYKDIKIIPKKRYEYMTKYLPLKGDEPFIMMRETAGIQANIDYKSEEDAIRKLSLALKMSPIISAIYANSSIRDGKLTKLKSNRAASWMKVDEQRCGLICKKLIEKPKDFNFSDYIDILLDVPMIFIQRNDIYYGTTQTFREFMQHGLLGFEAQISDWKNQISLYFPDVRLKSYIEIRNHDAQNAKLTISVPAFWKGIMYNLGAIEEIEKILAKYEYEDFLNLRKITPLIGINAKIGKLYIIDLIKEFFNISYSCLKEKQLGEEKYLDPVYEYISLKKVPADLNN